jgi:hypothetical protein
MEQENYELEKELTSEESLELIARMIRKAKKDYLDTGLSAILWGGVTTFCSLVTFINYWLQWAPLEYVWFLMIVAVVPQILIAIQESKERKLKAYDDDLMFAILSTFTPFPYTMLYMAAAGQLAWFIPGLMLRTTYLKAKRQHV